MSDRIYNLGLVAEEHDRANKRCCAASAWVHQRAAVSCRARRGYYRQLDAQAVEELVALRQGRRPRLVALATLQLQLPEALRHEPPRLDMCRACAEILERMKSNEHAISVHSANVEAMYRLKGMLPAPAAASSSPEGTQPDPGRRVEEGAADNSSVAAQQQQESQQECDGGGAPDTPMWQQREQPLRGRRSAAAHQEQPECTGAVQALG
ncbi:expressed protein [Chlorella variabilis]|uniref:Expressed protein n=1 Tax=Chlorella variabilis TaxID=554065 RepID=E1ZB75_CHLVA|nr:expressed protein [Chlorella variabilis]EFN56977.1 expressed protein [Chlorella variabilis]|eukprot:XP_005849079.1 expressed protein [Chlorella variabilis]